MDKSNWEHNLQKYDQLVKMIPSLERKGKKNPYTSVNGHMFSFLGKDGNLAIRLPADLREKFILDHSSSLAEAYGVVMKEYVLVPSELFEEMKLLAKYLNASLTYTKSLKPKKLKNN